MLILNRSTFAILVFGFLTIGNAGAASFAAQVAATEAQACTE